MPVLRHAILKRIQDGDSIVVLEYEPELYLTRLKRLFKEELLASKKGKNRRVTQDQAVTCLTKAYNNVNHEFREQTVKIV